MREPIADLVARISEWQTDRTLLAEQESTGDYPAPGDWHDNDDDAAELLDNATAIVEHTAAVLAELREFFADNATGMTCTEVERLAELYRAAGDPHTAADLVDAHAERDEEGDAHFDTIECGHCGIRVAYADTRDGMHADACPEVTR